jgi:uncharacterized protein involved in response to NO
LFFPLGALLGIAGVSIWPLYAWGVTSGYSGRSHAFVQIDGFLFAFIAGFLWTAMPRFTGTANPPRAVQHAVASLQVLAAAAFEFQYFFTGHLIFLVAYITFMAVAANRFVNRRHPPPETFVLVGLGLISGLIGSIINAGIAGEIVQPGLDLVGRRLMTEGMVLLLVLGVGGFLAPRLLGFAQLPNFQQIGKASGPAGPPLSVTRRQSVFGIAGLILVGSIIVEYGFKVPVLAWVRAAVATLVVFVNVQPWRAPAVRTTLAWCVWAAHWFFVAGVWLVALLPKYRPDFLHVLFMGSFTLLILAVGTRVALSHGGHGLTEERRSWPLRIGITTGLIALLARLGAPFAPNTYFDHLAWAAVLWIGGIVLWGVYLFRRIRSRA